MARSEPNRERDDYPELVRPTGRLQHMGTVAPDRQDFMEDHRITYRFTFEDGSQETFNLELDGSTLELKNEPSNLPDWTRLEFHQCSNCPLKVEESPHCPAAAQLVELLAGFGRVLSYEKMKVEVETDERTVAIDSTAQQGVSSLMGLIMATSGCPVTASFRPMARFHLPGASLLETVYRATSMYLLAQYLRKIGDETADLELDGLAKIYDEVRTVNSSFADRLRGASEEDSAINAIVMLDMFAMSLPWAIEESLEDLRNVFTPYLEREEPAD